MNWYSKLRMVPKIVFPVGLLLIVALSLLAWQIQSRSSAALTQVAERELAGLAGQYGNEVRAFLEEALNASNTMASGIQQSLTDKTPFSRENLVSMLRGIHQGSNVLVAAGAIWEPNAFDGQDAVNAGEPGSEKDGRFVPYSVDGARELAVIEGYSSEAYYTEPKKTGKSFLSNPYTYNLDGQDVLMTTTASPVVVNGQVKGIITADILLDKISTLVGGVKAYGTGYGGLFTSNGTIVSHPRTDLKGKNLFELGRNADVSALRNAVNAAKPYMEVRSVDGEGEISYYMPVGFSGIDQYWYFVISAPLDEVLAEAHAISQFTIVSSAIVTILVLLLIFVVVRSCVKPIEYLAHVAEDIAHGNLKVDIQDANFSGEVGQLSGSMRTMIASLVDNITKAETMSDDARQQAEKAREAMVNAEASSRDAESKRKSMLVAADKLEEVANIVSSASEQLSSQIEESERGASEQASRVTETATAMDQMNATVLDVARNASNASDVSASTRKKAEDGASVVQQVVKSIQGVQAQSLTLKEDMVTLSGHAQAISQIMGVISDIADQTNLLALNAAIEAARAGDAGRGFAVVADEVRKLAEKTMSSTTDVGNAIRSIQQAADMSMTQVDATVKTIETATELASQSGAALSEIVSLVDNTAEQVRAIATASEEQSASSAEINQSITQVSSIAGETARSMQEAARAVSELAGQAQVLSRLIEDMKQS